MSWKYFHGNPDQSSPKEMAKLPDCPPWRQFRGNVDPAKDEAYRNAILQLAQADARSIQRGQSFRVQLDKNGASELVDSVNAAIHLRRPLLITGSPGSGKTSLAYAIAHELQLGPVLTWPITARSNLLDAEYRYDAIARLQDAQLDKTRKGKQDTKEEGEQDTKGEDKQDTKEEGDLGDYIQLGPVGTAFLPSMRPRVLLIDEIDKSDLNLPNDLLNLFEEGEFEIPELVRRKRRRDKAEHSDSTVIVRTADKDLEAPITNGRVTCHEFPIVIMTSNGERDFPPAFYRRCLRVQMPETTKDSLLPIVQSHFLTADENGWTKTETNLTELIGQFLDKEKKSDRATDQLLNAIYLMTRNDKPDGEEMKRLQNLLFRRLSEGDR
jgi:MoxR-like ATPase